ncbi:DUF4249 family protein [Spirosoma telluris]|uniref:DUF4249 family protein n=1 Tax=Spirosoma telluris TaxID=2183553 RepID=UPI002FC2A1B5
MRAYYTSGHDVFIELEDPADQRNYYRWDWIDYEPQHWCRSCYQGFYSIFNPIEVSHDRYISGPDLYEDCYFPHTVYTTDFVYNRNFDYVCRTQCWEMLHSYNVALFDDQYTNGGFIPNFKVAAIPFYQHGPCLVHVRQSSLTPDAYRYFKLFQDQTQNTGGLADTPPRPRLEMCTMWLTLNKWWWVILRPRVCIESLSILTVRIIRACLWATIPSTDIRVR